MSRLRCPEIRKLPKSTKITSIQWRNQTPGILEPIFMLSVYKADKLVDPSHPGATLKKSQFPAIQRDDLGVRMLPLGLLLREEKQFPAIPILSWRERVEKVKEAGITGNRFSNTPNIKNSKFRPGEQLYPERDYNNILLPSQNITPRGPILNLKLKKTESRIPVSFHVATSKGRMGQFRHQRKRLETRLRAALNLIVTKGAFCDRKEKKIGVNMDDSGRKWIMQGWAYMLYPTTKVHQMPYADLINLLRLLLTNLNSKAVQMENEWLNKSLLADEKRKSKVTSSERSKGQLPGPFNTALSREQGNLISSLSAGNPHGNKSDSPKIQDLLSKLSLVGLQKSRSPEASLAAASERSSEPFTDLAKDPSINPGTEGTNVLKNAEYVSSQKRKRKTKRKRADVENFPMKSLAGKPPAVWKKELISGLTLLLDPPDLNRNPTKTKR